MKNAEAIETLRANYPDACFEQLREAVDASIEALKAQDAAGDMISRQAAIAYSISGKTREIDGEKWIRVSEVRESIKTMPEAQPEQHGEWIEVMTEEWCTFDECKCSVCGVVEYFNKGWKKFSYCPNCGAKMEVQG